MPPIVPPHGGHLVDLLLDAASAREALARAAGLPSWDLRPHQVADLEMLLRGAFSPLTGFLGEADYTRVLRDGRLTDGTRWPLPITLDVTETFAASLARGDEVCLRDAEGVPLALLAVTDVWQPDRAAEALTVHGTDDPAHPGVAALRERRAPVCIGGPVRGLRPPVHYDFEPWRKSPSEVRARLSGLGRDATVACLASRPIHRARLAAIVDAARERDASILLLSVAASGHDSDLDHFARVRCHQIALAHCPPRTAELALLALRPWAGGLREAELGAIVARNHGATHLLVTPDDPSRAPVDAVVDALTMHAGELGVAPVPVGTTPTEADEVRRRIEADRDVPESLTWPAVAAVLREAYPPRRRQGFTVFFTGLSGSGKSTIANAVIARLRERGGRRVTLLDGDLVRKHLSSELGFSREHRDLNIRRIGFVAAEITRHGGIAVCAPIAPYTATRRDVRAMVEAVGGFFEVHVATPLEVCERRDRKGLYAKARAGLIKEFTGIDDPYETPLHPELRIDTETTPAEAAADQVVAALEHAGYLGDTDVEHAR
ncbi:MAG: adenylyl-sulfate kinase [Ectothiorhodospiraceae bacterium]|nr:adenylyl-sulfate kinase [Ectothiorhodospiraceae bacterium]